MPDSPDAVRAFIAVPLPDPILVFLGKLQSEIKLSGIKAAWPNPDTFHLTLKFLGMVSHDRLPSIQAVMERFSGYCPNLFLTVGRIGVFPGVRNPRVVWADIGGQTRRLTHLFRDLDRALCALEFPGQPRRFSPHITLGRIKSRVSPGVMSPLLNRFKNMRPEKFKATGLVLYQSRLTSEGAIHTRLFEVNLDVHR
jgi:RNA 2',3'-cyclic 3'-phosphodiesterase